MLPSFLIVDDHPLFLEALQSALEVAYPASRVDVAGDIRGARQKLGAARYDLVLLDLRVPDANGFDGVMDVRVACSKTPLAVISAQAGPEVAGKVKALGADGFISKNLPRKDIIKAVETLLQGQKLFPLPSESAGAPGTDAAQLLERLRQLTPQQLKVLYRVCEAKLNKQIAYELGVTETTIKAHVTLIFKKLGVHSRTQAVLLMQRMRPDLLHTEFGGLVMAEDAAG